MRYNFVLNLAKSNHSSEFNYHVNCLLNDQYNYQKPFLKDILTFEMRASNYRSIFCPSSTKTSIHLFALNDNSLSNIHIIKLMTLE